MNIYGGGEKVTCQNERKKKEGGGQDGTCKKKEKRRKEGGDA